jgi:WhiB family transcriptional regulator, redox-sensing transcriptional regulator
MKTDRSWGEDAMIPQGALDANGHGELRANWRDDAACRHADPDLFFPIATAGPALDQIDQAKRICRACPVQQPCLAWALELGVESGIWAGTTEDERRAIRAASAGHRRCAPKAARAHE